MPKSRKLLLLGRVGRVRLGEVKLGRVGLWRVRFGKANQTYPSP